MRLTINKFLGASAAVFLLLLVAIFVRLNTGTRQAAMSSAQTQRNRETKRVGQDVSAYVNQGEEVVLRLRSRLENGLCRGERIESCLTTELLGNSELTEVSFIEAVELGFEADGTTRLDPKGRRQVTVFRSRPGRDSEICTRETTGEGDAFTARTTCRSPYDVLDRSKPSQTEPDVDPTVDFGFETPASKDRRGRILFTDPSYSTIDKAKPEEERRVVLLFMHAAVEPSGKLIGVVKAGLSEEQIRALMARQKLSDSADDPFEVFITDENGLIVAAAGAPRPRDVNGDDLRIPLDLMTPAIRAAIESNAHREVPAEKDVSAAFNIKEDPYHVTYHLIPKTWGWRLGVVGPDEYFLRPLEKIRNETRSLVQFSVLALMAVMLMLWFVVAGAFRRIQGEAAKMRKFQFAATTPASPFADVKETLLSVERAKTAMRAMGKYVPLELVHSLFEANEDPKPSGNPREVTLMFSDIEGFTSRAEKETPDQVASWLGRYLATMASAVQTEKGTVDKFIGDAVMALWNAPGTVPDHAVCACRAALRCQDGLTALYRSPDWEGREALVTRIGLHVGSVFVGLFGSPDRLSYTAIGDSVNLAARLESLNKQYGTRILCSEDVVHRAGGHFEFRLIDRVAVKGKTQAIGVYELIGRKGEARVGAQVLSQYSEALAAYARGDFAGARLMFEKNENDPPSKTMARRCAEFLIEPPLQPWVGVVAAHEK
jgi:adenylate cyclase